MKKYLKLGATFLASTLLTSMAVVILPTYIAHAEEIGDYGDATRMPSMSFYSDPTSEMSFCWTTTNITATDLQVVEASIYEASNGFDDSSISRNIKIYEGTIEASQISGDGFIHRVYAHGLTPDTKYYYRFGDENLNMWCDIGTFKTAANTNRNL